MLLHTLRRYTLYFVGQLIKRAARPWVAELFRLVGDVLHVKSCACAGNLGIFEGPLCDKGVLGFYLVHSTWEPQIYELLTKNLFHDDVGTFIDVGANIGLTSIPLKLNCPGVIIFAIEADPENFAFLKNNMERNGVNNVELFSVAAYSEDGEIDFERSSKNAGDHRIRVGPPNSPIDHYGESARELIKVKAQRLDSFISSDTLPRPFVLKCDVQGAEVHVLQGAEYIMKDIDFMIIEFWPYGLRRTGSTVESFFSMLKDFPYGLIIDDNTFKAQYLRPIEEVIYQMKDVIYDESSTDHRELILAKTQHMK